MIDIDQWLGRNYLWQFQLSVFTSLLHIGWTRHVFSFAKISSSKIKQFDIDLKFLMILNKMATKSFHVLTKYYEKESLSYVWVAHFVKLKRMNFWHVQIFIQNLLLYWWKLFLPSFGGWVINYFEWFFLMFFPVLKVYGHL